MQASGTPILDVESKRLTALAYVARTFGGFHASIGNGGWIDPRGKLVLENSLSIGVFSDATDSTIDAMAEYLRALFAQESVLVAVTDASVRFVEARHLAA